LDTRECIRRYNTKRWITLRNYKLQLNPLCEVCEAAGKVEAATEVHHIHALKDENDDGFYDLDNLQAICTKCHRLETNLQNSKRSDDNIERGKKLMKDLES